MRFMAIIIFISSSAAMSAAESWPQFRGPGGQGHAASDRAPLEWSETQNIVWKTPIPGRGWSSPVVWGDQVWMTTAIEHPMSKEERENYEIPDTVSHLPMHVLASVEFRAVCVDRKTGQLLHDVSLFAADHPDPIHALNSYASPTPVIERGRVYCHFGGFGTASVDTQSGSIIWRTVFPLEHYVGPGSSPVVYENLLVLTCDGADQQYVVAVDKRSGKTVWKMPRPPIRATNPDFRKSYCTPVVIEVDGRDQLVIPGAQWTVAYEPRTGKEVWMVDHGRGFSLVPRPIFDGQRLFFCTGFMAPSLWAVRPDGVGRLPKSHVLWTARRQIPTMSSPLVVDDRLFVISDGGVATCLDAVTGDERWRKRVPGEYSASLLHAAGRIYAFSHGGVTTVFQPDDAFQKLAENHLPGKIMATPAVVDRAMFLRTDTTLYRIEE